MSDISIHLLRRLVRLDPRTGRLYWLPRTPDMFAGKSRQSPEWRCNRWNSRHAGREAIGNKSQGYRVGYLLGRIVGAHRVAFALHHGHWPVGQVDHQNGVRSDNRPDNLRDVTAAQNAKNLKRYACNTSGVTGVVWNQAERRWKARITVDNRRINLGTFHDFSTAVAARKHAEVEYGFHPNHGRARCAALSEITKLTGGSDDRA